MGRKLEVFDQRAKELIRDGIAEAYDGDMKINEKMKTNFFNPKKDKRK